MHISEPIDAKQELVAGFFAGPAAERHSANFTFDLDFGVIDRAFLDGLAENGQPQSRSERILLPPTHVWSGNGKTRAPMALCEFVAYKTALAYDNKAGIEENLGPAEHFEFFDSSGDVSDTQGYAFMYDGMAFVIMRGTENKSDWKINLQDQFTDQLQGQGKWKTWRLVKRLKKRHGPKVAALLSELESKPGRHLGFAIGWAAVHGKISAHLKALFPPGVPVVLAGHSLGGALALIGARELKRDGHNVAAVITFGAPQAGNEMFTKEYEAEGLRERTVLFEAQGDSVPRVMRRWYYRLHRSLRARVDKFAAARVMSVPPAQFAMAGNAWTFAAQPALSATEVAGAIRAIIDAKARKEKEEAEQKAKKEKEEAEQKAKKEKDEAERKAKDEAARAAQDAAPPAATTAPAASTDAAPPAQNPAQTSEAGKQTGSGNDQLAWLIVGGILGLFLLLFLWLFVRSKLSAHAVIDRYALYLSTLSYQHIRALRAAEPGAVADKLELANADLARYMRFIRSDHGNASYIIKAKASDLPVRLKSDLDLATFLQDQKNII